MVLRSKPRCDLVCIWECGVQVGVSWCWIGICIVCFPVLVYRSGCTDAWVVPVWWDGCVVQVLLGEVCQWWGGWYKGWQFNVKLATYLLLLDVVGSGCGALSCRVWALWRLQFGSKQIIAKHVTDVTRDALITLFCLYLYRSYSKNKLHSLS